MSATVIAVASDSGHNFSKITKPVITLVAGFGVQGDAHAGVTVKHRSRVAKDPMAPNLRQVHLIHTELFDEVGQKGFIVKPGQMGENITTQGVDLLGLPQGTILQIGSEVMIEITGLRNPCRQINGIQNGLMNEMVYKGEDGNLIRKSGVMSIVLKGGDVRAGDEIIVKRPDGAHKPLECV